MVAAVRTESVEDGLVSLIITVTPATYDRFAELVKQGVPAHRVLERLLDRDPHDHEHRCPTCARRAEHEHVARPDDPLPFTA